MKGTVTYHLRDESGELAHHGRYSVDDVDKAADVFRQLESDAPETAAAASSSTAPAKKAAKPRTKKRR